jgi:Fic family protein
MMYNWQIPEWPNFNYNTSIVEDQAFLFIEQQGLLNGLLKGISTKEQTETLIELLSNEATKTAAIEGEIYSKEDIVSSIINNLGIVIKQKQVKNKDAKKIAQLVVESRNTFDQPLTESTLLNWHKILFSEHKKINAGKWRMKKAAMQVISGTIGKEKVYYEAPPSAIVPKEMKYFIQWFNDTAPTGKLPIKHAPIRAAIAHLYFESIHPFEDGNGRIGRVLAEKALSQTVGSPIFISLSSSIEKNKKLYYNRLSESQKTLDINKWIGYFIDTILTAQQEAQEVITFTIKKNMFFAAFRDKLNERALKVISKMFDAGLKGFVGGMNAKKYMGITKASKATATRDLQYLVSIGVFESKGEGRSTHYHIIL